MKITKIELTGGFDIRTRPVFPNEELGDKNKKQFILWDEDKLTVYYEDKGEEHSNIIIAYPFYIYDGATIPFNIGKGNMKLLIPALFHDIMCENKGIINYNRKLSSLIFKELLIQCGVNKCVAQMMYLAVDTYQKFQEGWKNE